MPALNYQSRLRPQTMMLQPQTQLSPNPGTVGTQMMNPGSPVSITWKFAPAGGGSIAPARTKQTAQPVTTPQTTMTPARATEVAAPIRPREFWEDETYVSRLQPEAMKEPATERTPYESVVSPPVPGELYGKAIAPVYQKYLEASERAKAMLSKRGMGRSGALLGHPELGEQALFREFAREAGAISSQVAIEEEKARQEWARLGLNERQIEEMARQFDENLAWEKEEFGITLSWEQQKWVEDIAFRYKELAQQGDISYQQMKNDMTKFYALLKQDGWIAKRKLDIEERQLDIDEAYKQGRLDIDQYDAETRRNQQEHDAVMDMLRYDLDVYIAELSENEIFGYWDEGYGPDDPNYPSMYLPDGTINPAWSRYVDEHYHKGRLDLEEWSIQIASILGLMGVSNEEATGEEPTGQEPTTPTYPELPTDLYGWWPGAKWSWDDFVRQYPAYANDPEDIEKIKEILQANPNISWEQFIRALARSYGPNIPPGFDLPGIGGGGNRLFGWQPAGGGR